MTIHRYESTKEEVNSTNGPVIFLAGPTVRGNQTHLTSWRFEAIEIFQRFGFNGSLILPEFLSKTQSDKGRFDLPVWEHNGLKRADCILFWLCRTKTDLIGLNTNSEHGFWLAKAPEKLVYGRPDDAFRIDYNDVMWKQVYKEIQEELEVALNTKINEPLPPIYNTLENTVLASIDLANYIHLHGTN